MQFKDAAYEILKQAGEPLHYNEITDRALAKGILTTSGQTPHATMGSRLYTDTLRPDSQFRRVDKGVFGLRERQPGDVSQTILRLNNQTRKKLHQLISNMPPERFEALVKELLIALGFDETTVEATSYSKDGGIDVRGIMNGGGITEVNAAVQVKRWKKNVQAPMVQQLRGSLNIQQQGIMVTTSDYSSGAKKEAEAPGKTRISLVNGEQLVDLLIRYNIGVKSEQHTLISLDEELWQELGAMEVPASTQTPAKMSTKPKPIKVSFPLPIQASFKGRTVEGQLLDLGGRIKIADQEFDSPSGAGKAVTGWKAVDGWNFWRFQDGETRAWMKIDFLRKQRNS
jgi:restriction system protein